MVPQCSLGDVVALDVYLLGSMTLRCDYSYSATKGLHAQTGLNVRLWMVVPCM